MPLTLSRVDVRALAEEAVWMIGSLAGHSTIEVRIGRDPVMGRK